MTWFAFSLASVVSLAVAELSLQNVLNRKKSFTPRTTAFLGYVLQSVLILPFLIFFFREDFLSIFTPEIFPRIMAVCLISSIATLFYAKSFQVKNISVSSIFGSLSIVVSTCLGIYFYNEGTHFIKFVGIAAILVSIVILNIRNAALEKNHFYGLAAGALYGLCYVLDKGNVQSITPPVYVFWLFLFTAFFVFIFNPKEVIVSIRDESFPTFKIIVLSSIGFLLYNLLTFMAYTTGGEVGKVDAINNSQVFLIIIFEYFILRQKTSIGRKLLAAAIAFGGVLILGLYQ